MSTNLKPCPFCNSDNVAVAALAAEIERLRECKNFTLSDPQRLLSRRDVDGVCASLDICFEGKDSTVRCGPCAIRAAEAVGVAVEYSIPKAPQEARLSRELGTAKAEIVRLREALRQIADLDEVEAALDPEWTINRARNALAEGRP